MEMKRHEKYIVNSRLYTWIYTLRRLKPFIAFAGNNISGNTLELGCGIGKTSHFIKKNYQDITLLASDYDPDQIKTALKTAAKFDKEDGFAIRFVVEDAAKLSFSNSFFDTVVQLLAFHHVPNYQLAVKEAARVLKPGGCLVMLDVGVKWSNLLLHFSRKPDSMFTKQEMIQELEKQGFVIEKEQGSHLFMILARKL